MNSVSVITLVHGRKQHLGNLIIGLHQSDILPQELVIIHMNEESTYPLPATSFPQYRYQVNSTDTKIPLAAARNEGVNQAQHNFLVFLDVDCIPSPTLIGNYLKAKQQFDGLIMGEIRYLPKGALPARWQTSELAQWGVPHPNRPSISSAVEPTERYELFWSLNFAITRQNFEKIGGFDTQYQGYGAEDTDLAFTARQRNIPFALGSATCYHQHHPVYQPPLQHFQDIVVNARRFYEKWQTWPMEGWLQKFTERKLIQWEARGSTIEILREPNSDEIQAAYHEAPAGF
ncbi:glycosyltransferase family 2 protein [Tunicatimonas pelagia]|uniref:glycosyltransferase family 2 protein n=1 Tax=Tunicatimonas pelagia TaxID=931531 RepID=UPI002666A865|nr:glycosyltransferase family 2 protein [Tunicatimonas pelagia]WKN42186.1 glycosyltransferase family 2 protein [Tunicatimonas pelagia]